MDYIIVGWRFDLKLETYIKDWGLPFHTLRIAILLVRHDFLCSQYSATLYLEWAVIKIIRVTTAQGK